MNKPIQISASILCADFSCLKEDVRRCEEAGVDMLHVDVMDGHFVPNITTGPLLVEAIRPLTKLPLEAHLMIDHPGDYIDAFCRAGTDIVSIHAECYGPLREACRSYGQYPKEVDSVDPDRVRADIRRIKAHGKRVHMVLNPGTPLCLEAVLDDLDGVLVMSVNPGFSRQKFMPEVLSKVARLKGRFKGDIAIDGGINDETAPAAVKAGVNILATASYFFGASNQKAAVRLLKSLSPD